LLPGSLLPWSLLPGSLLPGSLLPGSLLSGSSLPVKLNLQLPKPLADGLQLNLVEHPNLLLHAVLSELPKAFLPRDMETRRNSISLPLSLKTGPPTEPPVHPS
jgi:hypothetical protein